VNVLDASALLAFLFRESGHQTVEKVITDCCVGSVNLAEVLARFSRDGHDPHAAYRRIEASPVEIVSFTGEQAVLAAALVPQAQPLGLSLGDRACLALSISRNCPVLTADHAWSELELPIDVIQIRDGAAP
jgi:ribonuclease VapC